MIQIPAHPLYRVVMAREAHTFHLPEPPDQLGRFPCSPARRRKLPISTKKRRHPWWVLAVALLLDGLFTLATSPGDPHRSYRSPRQPKKEVLKDYQLVFSFVSGRRYAHGTTLVVTVSGKFVQSRGFGQSWNCTPRGLTRDESPTTPEASQRQRLSSSCLGPGRARPWLQYRQSPLVLDGPSPATPTGDTPPRRAARHSPSRNKPYLVRNDRQGADPKRAVTLRIDARSALRKEGVASEPLLSFTGEGPSGREARSRPIDSRYHTGPAGARSFRPFSLYAATPSTAAMHAIRSQTSDFGTMTTCLAPFFSFHRLPASYPGTRQCYSLVPPSQPFVWLDPSHIPGVQDPAQRLLPSDRHAPQCTLPTLFPRRCGRGSCLGTEWLAALLHSSASYPYFCCASSLAR